MARARYTIASIFCEVIWQPFSVDNMSDHPELVPLLGEIQTTLAGSGETYSKHSARVWNALTMRALQKLGRDSASSQSSQPSPSHKCAKAVDRIIDILSPLVGSSNEIKLRKDLLTLAQLALDIWYVAQTDELQISVHPNLDPDRCQDWRSQSLDPDLGFDVTSSTLPRIYTLFPRIIASSEVPRNREVPAKSMPGGFWGENHEPEVIETEIHTGKGLRESSPLVMAGKEEAEDARYQLIQENLDKEMAEMETRAKELRARNERSGKHSRSGSMVSPGTPTSSPTSQWGAKNFVRE